METTNYTSMLLNDDEVEMIGTALQYFLDDNNAKLSNRSLFGIDAAEAAVRTEWMNQAQQLLEERFGGKE